MPAIKLHTTPVDKTGTWDGPKAVADAPNNPAVLRYMHAWVNAKGDASAKGSYKFPHHEPGTDTPAVIKGVNNALSRLPQATIPAGDRAGVEAHLRKHRKDAGFAESMSEAEILEEVKYIKEADDLKREEAQQLLEAIALQEQRNMGDWLEARIHSMFTDMADSLFGDGMMLRDERIILSAAIGDALDAFRAKLEADAPQLYQRGPFDGAPEAGVTQMTNASREAATIKSKARAAAKALQSLLADKTLPKDLHDSVSNVVDSLQKTWADLASDSGTAESKAFELGGDFIPLLEKAVRRDGTIPLKIIQPGWGSSGYYPAEVLKRDGPKIFTKETKMYWNHQTLEQEAARPEGDLRDLAAVFTTGASWQDNGPKGPGLYADAQVFEAFQQSVDDLAPHIGVSIRAMGQAVQGTVEGREGPIIQSLVARKSVDFVTEPGAGGEIITMFEAARKPTTTDGQKSADADMKKTGMVPAQENATSNVANKPSTLEEDMELKDLQEQVATLTTRSDELATENARLKETNAMRDAKEQVREALGSLTNLPEVTKARLIESLAKTPPMKEGVLDAEAFATVIENAVKTEVKYLESVLGQGQIRGLGESRNDEDEGGEENLEESLQESFGALGWSESEAKLAARGRG